MIREYLVKLAVESMQADDIKLPIVAADNRTFDLIVGLVYTVLAALAIFMIVRAGLLFVTNGNDPKSVKEARETILYAVGGLVASTAVFLLIQFVINSLRR